MFHVVLPPVLCLETTPKMAPELKCDTQFNNALDQFWTDDDPTTQPVMSQDGLQNQSKKAKIAKLISGTP